MRVLLITYYLPYPPISGHSIRNYNLFRRIGLKHEVWLLTFSKESVNPEHVARLREFCQDVQILPISDRGALASPVQALRYALSGIPLDLRLYYRSDAAQRITELVQGAYFDIIQIEDSFMAQYHNAIPPTVRSRTVLTLIDVVFDKYDRIYCFEKQLSRRLRLWLYSRMMRRWEPRYLERFDRCVAMSSRDRDLLLALNPRLRIDVVPNGVDTHTHRPLPPPPGNAVPRLIFVGNMDYRPNVDAAVRLCNRILPLIRDRVGKVEVWIVGTNPRPELRLLNGNDVHVTGRVGDVQPYYQQSQVCVVPLRAGGGTRLKILEAMALGRPVVSTTIGCEGLDAVEGRHLLIADSDEEFAAKTARLLLDQALWQDLSRCARQLVEQKYDWDILAGQLMSLYDELVG